MAKERREITVTSTFDIETEAWDKPVLCGQWHSVYGYRVTRDIEELARWLLEPGYHWAHNGGRFDALAVLDVWRAWGETCTAIFGGGRIISLRCGSSILCDSKALWPCSLEEITATQVEGKQKFPLSCTCGEACGGYCGIKRHMPEAHYRLVGEYLRLDCKSLFDALAELQDFAATHDIDLAMTLGASAFASAKRMLDFAPDKHSLVEHAFRRSAYYGGRTQSIRTGHTGPGREKDVIGMYPSQLSALSMPVGKVSEVSGRSAQAYFRSGRPGVYRCVVTVPDSHVPPLPYRSKKRLCYPHGTFEGTYTQIELENAVENYGVEIKAFSDARVYASAQNIFKPWVAHLIGLRLAVGKDTPLGIFLKLFMNSLYGKLASRPEKTRMLINPLRIREGDVMIRDGVFTRTHEALDICAHPVWAAYTTSGGRIKLLDKLTEGPDDDTFYCDTDSVMSADARSKGMGDGLGDWEEKRAFKNMYIVAPKVYGLDYGDKIKSRAKGVRLKRDEMPVPGTHYAVASGVKGAKSLASHEEDKFFERTDMTRLLTPRSGDRIQLENGRTRAPHISECE